MMTVAAISTRAFRIVSMQANARISPTNIIDRLKAQANNSSRTIQHAFFGE